MCHGEKYIQHKVPKGEKVPEGKNLLRSCIHLGIAFVPGVAFLATFASCVEPLPLLEGLVVFLEFSVLLHDFLLVVLSPYLPLLED
jgi:hypothetical protein